MFLTTVTKTHSLYSNPGTLQLHSTNSIPASANLNIYGCLARAQMPLAYTSPSACRRSGGQATWTLNRVERMLR